MFKLGRFYRHNLFIDVDFLVKDIVHRSEDVHKLYVHWRNINTKELISSDTIDIKVKDFDKYTEVKSNGD